VPVVAVTHAIKIAPVGKLVTDRVLAQLAIPWVTIAVITNDCPGRKFAPIAADRRRAVRAGIRCAEDWLFCANDCLHWWVIDDRVVARSSTMKRRLGARYLVVMVVMVAVIVVVAPIAAVVAAHAVMIVAIVLAPVAAAVLTIIAIVVVATVVTSAPMGERGAASDN
jgi:hypothetical protein